MPKEGLFPSQALTKTAVSGRLGVTPTLLNHFAPITKKTFGAVMCAKG
jgi:hypothetical protein